jgi:hypothetical protein
MIFNTVSRHGFRRAALALAIILLMTFAANARAQTTLFFDDFNGPTLNPAFQASLPSLGSTIDVTYLGAPNYSYGTLDGASVLRLTNTLDTRQRRGWSTSSSFAVTDFRYEMRFNVLVQSPTTSIDRFLEAWLIDPADPSRYINAGPNGAQYGVVRYLSAISSIDGLSQSQPFNYQDNTWYRLVITRAANQNIRASLFADDGTTELIGQTFGFNASAFPAGFQLGLAQSTGVPGAPYPVDVAIDYVRLTTSAVPEPPTGMLIILGIPLGGLILLCRNRTNRHRSNSCPVLTL